MCLHSHCSSWWIHTLPLMVALPTSQRGHLITAKEQPRSSWPLWVAVTVCGIKDLFAFTPVIACCRLSSSSSLVRVAFCGSAVPGLHLPQSSLSLLSVEAVSGPWRSSSHIVSSVSEAGREPTLGLRRSTSRGFTLMGAPLSSWPQCKPETVFCIQHWSCFT